MYTKLILKINRVFWGSIETFFPGNLPPINAVFNEQPSQHQYKRVYILLWLLLSCNQNWNGQKTVVELINIRCHENSFVRSRSFFLPMKTRIQKAILVSALQGYKHGQKHKYTNTNTQTQIHKHKYTNTKAAEIFPSNVLSTLKDRAIKTLIQ